MAGEELSTDVVEKHDPCGLYQIPDYGEHVLPDAAPEMAPEAGTLVTEVPGYLYTPLYSVEELEAGAIPDIVVPAQVRRGQDMVQMAWIGGDPGVDFPLVRLEQQQGDGSWAPVLNPSGRAIENGPDILTTWTPAPLYTWDDTQTHYWYAAWQVVGPNDARMGLPLGMYRLHVEGQTFGGVATSWPWDAAPYSVDSPTFEVLPGALTLEASGNDLWASIRGADRGFRMLGLNASSDGGVRLDNDAVTLDLVYGDGHSDTLVLSGDGSSGRSTFVGVLAGVVSVTATDIYGNQGQLSLVTP
jgi:hypothetical protein